jgi:hypothetical protein
MIHVFALMLYIGAGEDKKLISDDMYFRKIESCNYYAEQLIKSFGSHPNNDPRRAYCIPKTVDPAKEQIYY